MKTKAEIRENGLTYYANQTSEERATLMQFVVRQVTATNVWQNAEHIALTLSQSNELPTELLIQTALLQKKKVYLPRVAPNHQLKFIQIDETTQYEKHRFGMLEPIGDALIDVTELDLIMVPGIAFSEQGDRVGFGGGYYDRFLAEHKEISTMGIAATELITVAPNWHVEPFDVSVDTIVRIGERHA
jgi:5-formyltetrahydrofolate cyclo-ligase